MELALDRRHCLRRGRTDYLLESPVFQVYCTVSFFLLSPVTAGGGFECLYFVFLLWSLKGLNLGPPDYESGATNQLS